MANKQKETENFVIDCLEEVINGHWQIIQSLLKLKRRLEKEDSTESS